MPRTVRDILWDALKELEHSKDAQANDPAVVKLRDDITMAIFRLQVARASRESEEPKAA